MMFVTQQRISAHFIGLCSLLFLLNAFKSCCGVKHRSQRCEDGGKGAETTPAQAKWPQGCKEEEEEAAG